MNKLTPLVRKIIYWFCIAALLIPLSMVSRPATRAVRSDSNRSVEGKNNEGGKLAQLRDTYGLAQSKLMEIDPASETMKLASVGLRGIAVNMLWMQAMEHRKTHNWDQLRSTLNALVKIQPNFIKVWEYQAHNLSYNISVEFDDYEYRYHWVKEGIKFLTEGIPYNYRNHRITDNLGFFTGMKIGRSDEKEQFRRMFRQDNDFHDELRLNGRGIDPELYDTREYGHDNWKLAYHWYDKSRGLVEKYPDEQHLSDMMFFRKRPMQLMNQARGLQTEFSTDEIIQEIWKDANREWKQFGEREIRSSTGLPFTFNGLAGMESELIDLQNELDELVPDYRDGFMKEAIDAAELSEIQLEALDLPVDERTEEQSIIAAHAEKLIQFQSSSIDGKIAEKAAAGDLADARRLARRVATVMSRMRFADSYAETINYKYWDIRSEAESKDITVDARQAMFRAKEMKRNSIFDDEYQFDPKTKKRRVIKKGAIAIFEEAFEKWSIVLNTPEVQTEKLIDGQLIDDLMDACGEYYDMLRISGRDWPENFAFQKYIDERSEFGDDNLPTSQDVADRVTGRSDGDPETRKRQAKIAAEARSADETPAKKADQPDASIIKLHSAIIADEVDDD